MRVRPFVVTEQLPSQRIAVAVNDVPVGTATVERPTMLRFPIPWTVLAAHATTNVIFSLPDAAQPRELREGHDRRRLAFAFEKLVFRGDSASVAAPAPAIAETNGVLP